jgi:hypothetical protein
MTFLGDRLETGGEDVSWKKRKSKKWQREWASRLGI